MQLKDLMVVLVLIGLVATCIAGAAYSLNAEYNPGTSLNLSVVDDMGQDVNEVNEIANSSYNLVNSGEMSAGGYFGVIFESIGNFLKVILSVITVPFKWVASLGNTIGIPSFISIAITTILLIVVVFAVIAAILRKSV